MAAKTFHGARAAVVIGICGSLYGAVQGCATWEAIPAQRRTNEHASELIGRRVRLIKGDSSRVLAVTGVDYPWIEGTETDWQHHVIPVRLDLRQFDRIEVKEDSPSAERIALFFGGIAVVAGAASIWLLWAFSHR